MKTILAVVLVLLLAGCSVPVVEVTSSPEYADLLAQYNTVAQEKEQATAENARLAGEIELLEAAALQVTEEINELKSDNTRLTTENKQLSDVNERYKDLSDSEIRAQTEENNRKAEEDRAAREKQLSEEAAEREREEAERRAAEEAELKKGYDTGITYNQLARTPDDYIGKKVTFKGKVIQVMEGDGEVQLRIAVKNNYDTVILVFYDSSIVKSRVLENDTITILGISMGLYTYESTMGGNITVPLVSVDKVE